MRARIHSTLLLLALSIPTASAFSFAAAPEVPAGLSWIDDGPEAPQIPTDLGVAREVVAFTPLGDVDADGRADVLMQTIDMASGDVVYQAVGGAGLEQRLWQIVAAPGTTLVPSGDLDADGVADHLLSLATTSVDTVGDGAGDASVQRVTASGEVVFRPVGGVGGSVLFEHSLPTTLDSVRSGVAGAAGVAQERVTAQTGQVQAVAQGTVFSVQEKAETTRTLLLDALPTSSLTEVQNDVTLSFLDASGTVRATVELADPNVNVAGMISSDLDLDGVADGVVLQLEKVSPTEENPAVRPVLTALDGATGAVAWEVTFDAVAGTPMLLPDLGDLDGDGKSELAYLEAVTTAGTAEASGVVRVLSGATGQVIATAETASGVVGVLPLGDLDADGAMEALKFVDANAGATVVAAVDARLNEVWSIELPDGQVPINAVHDPFTGALSGFQDWDLDGVADVAVGTSMAVGVEDGVLDVALHSGIDGALAWQGTYEQVVGAAVLPDLSATGSHDLAVIASTDAVVEVGKGLVEANDLVLTVVRGADGAGVWRLPIVLPGAIPDGTAVLAEVTSLGDVDGDAVADLQLHLEFTAETGAALAHTGINHVSTAADAVGHTYVLSGVDGAVLRSHADAAGDMSVPLQEPGPVAPLSAFRGGSEAEASEDAPLPLVAALAALALAAVAVRRRR